MKRIDIVYGGLQYSVGGRELDDVLREIATGLSAGPGWLRVNSGEGEHREALLMLTPGVDLAVIPIPDPLPPTDGSADPFSNDAFAGVESIP